MQPNFDSKFAHKLQNSVIYDHFAVNYEEKVLWDWRLVTLRTYRLSLQSTSR